MKELKAIPTITSVNIKIEEQKQIIELQCDRVVDAMQEVMKVLKGENVRHITSREATLEDTYIQLIGGESDGV